MLKTQKEISNWLLKMQINDWMINEDLVVHVMGDVKLNNQKLGQLKELPVQFGVVKGNFYCSRNYLTSLKGSPQTVEGHFICSFNNLRSLEYGPETVGQSFDCSNNLLTSFKGAPKKVGKDFIARENNIVSVSDLSTKFGGELFCSLAIDQKTLLKMQDKQPSVKPEASPMLDNVKDIIDFLNSVKAQNFIIKKDLTVDVVGDLILSNCALKSIPVQFGTVDGDFDCTNSLLLSLKGSPHTVKGNFYCAENKLTSLSDAPKKIQGNVYAEGNPIATLSDFSSEFTGKLYCNELIPKPKKILEFFDKAGRLEIDYSTLNKILIKNAKKSSMKM